MFTFLIPNEGLAQLGRPGFVATEQIVVGGILGLVFLFTEGAINGNVNQMWIPFFLASTLSTVRELCKDAADMDGDSIAYLQTFPGNSG